MACPALATTNIPANSNGNGLCVVDTLGVAGNGDISNFQAKWTLNYSTINLDMTTADGALTSDATVSPNPLYADRADSTKMYTDIDNHDTLISPVNVSSQIVTATDGKDVNFSLNVNTPSAASGTATVSGTATQATREFDGFYSASSGGAQYIDEAGNLLQAGATAAVGVAAGQSATWYAQYKCAQPTSVPTPTLTGWRFVSWNTESDGSGTTVTPGGTAQGATDLANGCITDTTTLYAIWAQKTTTIKYECGASDAATPVGGSYTGSGLTDNTNHTNTATYDTSYSHPEGADVCTLQGYTFNSWYCVEGTTGSITTGGLTGNGIVDSKWHEDVVNVTCTAVWDNNVITTNWNAANGTIDANDQGGQNCTYDGNIDLPTVTRAGYTFDGWEVTSTTPSQQ